MWKCIVSVDVALVAHTCLNARDFWRPFHVFTDASHFAFGARIGRCDSNEQLHPIAFEGKKLTASHLDYSVIENEYCMQSHGVYRLLSVCACYTEVLNLYCDHRPLRWLHNRMQHTSKQAGPCCCKTSISFLTSSKELSSGLSELDILLCTSFL